MIRQAILENLIDAVEDTREWLEFAKYDINGLEGFEEMEDELEATEALKEAKELFQTMKAKATNLNERITRDIHRTKALIEEIKELQINI